MCLKIFLFEQKDNKMSGICLVSDDKNINNMNIGFDINYHVFIIFLDIHNETFFYY